MSDSIVNGLVMAAASVIAALLAWFTARRTGKTSEITAKADAENKASDNWRELYLEVRKTVAELAEKVKTQDDSIETLKQGYSDQQTTITEQAHLIRQQEGREYRTRTDLAAVFTWIEGGMKPPAPTRPSYLTADEYLNPR